MEGISYNRGDAARLTEDIGKAIGSVNDFMYEKYDELLLTFNRNWNGPDEIAFMNNYLVSIKTIFTNLDKVGIAIASFIMSASEAMVEYQNRISTELGGGKIEFNSESKYNVICNKMKITERPETPLSSFGEGEQLGLLSANAATELVDALDTYTTGIQSKVKESLGAVEVGNAFVSSENATMGIQPFITSVAESMQGLTNLVDSFKNDTIPELINAYKAQSASMSSDASKAASDIDVGIHG